MRSTVNATSSTTGSSSWSASHSPFSVRWPRVRGSGREYLLLFGLRDILLQLFVAASQSSHKAYTAVFSYCADPAFLMNIAPSGKMQYCAGFHVPVCWKKEQLHPFFGKPDLSNTTRLL